MTAFKSWGGGLSFFYPLDPISNTDHKKFSQLRIWEENLTTIIYLNYRAGGPVNANKANGFEISFLKSKITFNCHHHLPYERQNQNN